MRASFDRRTRRSIEWPYLSADARRLLVAGAEDGMAAHSRWGPALLLTLGLGGWSGLPPPARDPDVSEHWYSLGCAVWARHMRDRVEDLRGSGGLDATDAAHFDAAILDRSRACAARGFDTLRLLISLGEALRDWPPASAGPSFEGATDVLSSRNPGIEPGIGVPQLRR